MKRRTLSIFAATALLPALSGCPGAASLDYGVWIFTITNMGGPMGEVNALVILQHDVTLNPPANYPGNYDNFGGLVIWQSNGSNVGFSLTTPSGQFEFEGTIQSPSSMSGTWFNSNAPASGGSWSAELDPDT